MRPYHFIYLSAAFAQLCFANTQDDAIALPSSPVEMNEWEAQKEFFQENGYLWIKNFFSTEQVALLKSWSVEIELASQSILTLLHSSEGQRLNLAKAIPGTLIIVPEAKNPLLACRAEDILSFNPDLYHLVTGTVTAYIGHLLGEPYVLFKDKINFKWPGGGAFLPHQDFPAFEFLGPREHITAMVCIDPATIENGCLHVAKNWKETFVEDTEIDPEQLSRGRAVLPYVVGGRDHGSIQKQYSDKISWLALEASPGDLVIFNSFLPHYSEPNQSKTARRAMFLTHNRLLEGDYRKAYYHIKREDPDNPMFHFGTPTKARTK
jgi:ectoine hydroxylase-related dioxygenase (phytanoyl-CoA dioxygenase family)